MKKFFIHIIIQGMSSSIPTASWSSIVDKGNIQTSPTTKLVVTYQVKPLAETPNRLFQLKLIKPFNLLLTNSYLNYCQPWFSYTDAHPLAAWYIWIDAIPIVSIQDRISQLPCLKFPYTYSVPFISREGIINTSHLSAVKIPNPKSQTRKIANLKS